MGCGQSVEAKRTLEIDKALHDEKTRNDRNQTIKLLLLGAGESGKSTIAKQLKLIHLDGFTTEERNAYKLAILNNALGSMRNLVRAAGDFGVPIAATAQAEIVKRPEYEILHEPYTPDVAAAIKTLWTDPGIRAAYERRNEFQLFDCAAYFFENIDRISQPAYVPSVDDVLASRVKTSGVNEIDFVYRNTRFRVVDVGGQRSERKKWMNCFDDVTAVVFVIALSEYDLKLYEDGVTNRMTESLRLFKETTNNKWFGSTPFLLFLNKSDLFQKKILKSPLEATFPDYNGGPNWETAANFIRDKFFSLVENQKKPLYAHITCATDTKSVTAVFEAVTDIIIRSVLENQHGS
ncbi:G-protein subunit alpha 1 [Pelomyxa schiedti]|nr:G-protein subunit alpha 1 [Pelomyxa schiedti]